MDFQYRRPTTAPGSGSKPQTNSVPRPGTGQQPTPVNAAPAQPRPQYAQRPQAAAVSTPAPVSAPAPQPEPVGESPQKPKKNLKLILIISGAAAALIIGLVAFIVVSSNQNAANQKLGTTQNQTPTTPQLSSLPSATLQVPEDIPNYTLNPASSAGKKVYASTDKRCELTLRSGITTELPGQDLAAAVMAIAGTYKASGAKVSEPSYGEALLLKTADGSQTYSIPTADFTAVGEQETTAQHYSLATFKDGTYVSVTQNCKANFGDTAITNLEDLTVKYVKVATGQSSN